MGSANRRQSLYRLLAAAPPGAPGATGPGPGTIETSALETIDNDRALSLMAAVGGIRDDRPGGPPPGTSFTATIETADNDTGAVLLHVTGDRAW